jgi:NADPH2:quinone reductase
MRALRFHEFGDPAAVLKLETVPDPPRDSDQAVVSVRAASINPSDVANVAGRFPETTRPRTPGRDYSGVVVAGPPRWIGVEVWGTGNAGFTQDGSHAELIRVPVASLRRKPAALSHAEAASVGVNFTTAWIGVMEYAGLQPGETLVVIGAGGGVGGAAIQIARRLGARAIGIDRAPPHPDSPAARMAHRFLTSPMEESVELVREETGGRGAEVVLNAVGGAAFEPSLRMLAHRGRMSFLASPGGRRQSFDLVDFYHNESQLFGVDTLKRDMSQSALLLESLAPAFENGGFQPPVIARIAGLAEAAEAYGEVAKGSLGRIVLAPDQG